MLQGEINWHIEDEPTTHAPAPATSCSAPRTAGTHLEPVGTEPTIRVAINARGEFHRYRPPRLQTPVRHIPLPRGEAGEGPK